jgi:hypothetical protein
VQRRHSQSFGSIVENLGVVYNSGYIVCGSKQGVFELRLRQSQSFESSVSRGGLKKSTTVSSHCHCLSLREYEEEDMKTIVWGGLFEAQLFQVMVIV